LSRRLSIILALTVLMSVVGNGVAFAQPSYQAKITELNYPRAVGVNSPANIKVKIYYSFLPAVTVQTRVKLLELDTNNQLSVSQIEFLEGSNIRPFDFVVSAPGVGKIWMLRALVEYKVGYTWTTDADEGSKDFQIEVKGEFKLELQGLPSNSWVSIDLSNQTVGPSGIFTVTLPAGTHNVEVPKIAYVSSLTRQVFKEWKGGYPTPSRSVVLEADATLYLAYETQHFLSLRSDVTANLNGQDWYKESLSATISITPTAIRESDFLGVLGVSRVFDCWLREDGTTIRQPTTLITVDRPQTIHAKWKTDYGSLYMLMAIAAVAIVVIIAFLLMKSRRRPPPPKPLITGTSFGVPLRPSSAQVAPPLLLRVQPVRAKKFCMQCGAEMDPAAVRCPTCGREL